MVRDDQPDAREGEAGRRGDAERFVVPLKLGNAGGGKGPQFRTNARRSEGPGDWATYQPRRVFKSCRRRCTRKRRQKPAIASTPCTTRSAAKTSWPMPMLNAAPTRAHRAWDGQDFADIEAYGVQRVAQLMGREHPDEAAVIDRPRWPGRPRAHRACN